MTSWHGFDSNQVTSKLGLLQLKAAGLELELLSPGGEGSRPKAENQRCTGVERLGDERWRNDDRSFARSMGPLTSDECLADTWRP